MLTSVIQVLNESFLFVVLPESATVLVFGACLIASTIGLRRFLDRHNEVKKNEKDSLKK